MKQLPFFALVLLSCHAGSSVPSTSTTLALEKGAQPVAQARDTAVDTILADDMRKHVELLASDAFEGRETLKPGYDKAAGYLSEQFASYGLTPMPGQKNFIVPYKLAKQSYDMAQTSLALRAADGDKALALGVEATPFSFSDEGALDADVVFAGYGISAPELGWDDYKGLDVKGKWVLVLRHAPGYLDEASPFFGGEPKEKKEAPSDAKGKGKGKGKGKAGKAGGSARDPRSYSTFTSKAFNAQEHGAKGMLLVSGPVTAEMADDLRLPERLSVPLTAAESAARDTKIAEQKAAMAARAAEQASAAADAKGSTKGASKGAPKGASKGAQAGGKAKAGAPAAEKTLLAFQISPSNAERLLANTKMRLLDLQKAVDAGTPAKKFKLKAHATARVTELKDAPLVTGKNVIGYLEGSDPQLKNEFVVVGGHFDHLGRMEGEEPNSDAAKKDTVYNGADDNASGTSGMLEIAQAFAGSAQRPRRSMLFMGFSGEEKGLLGSKALVKQGDLDTSKVAFMLNLDMIGRNSEEPVEFVGAEYASGVRDMAEGASAKLGLDIEFEEPAQKKPVSAKRFVFGPYSAASDHDSFFQKEVPMAFFFTGLHKDYHQLSDHADKLDYARMQLIARFGYALTREIANTESAPIFIHKLDWLGASVQTIGGASTVTALEPDSRASKAGLTLGDTIARIGESVLQKGSAKDAEGEMRSGGYLLDHLAPGTETALQVQRGGKTLDVSVTRSKRGYLGIYPGSLSEEDRQKYGLDSSEGVLIASTGPEAPAYKSGLREGDIITKLRGYSVNNGSLMSILSRIGAGETITVQVIREGKRIDMPLTLGEPPSF